MPVNPDDLTRFTSDGEVHQILTTKNNDPVLTVAGWYRAKCKCGLTCDASPADLEDTLRFNTGLLPAVTCLTCLLP